MKRQLYTIISALFAAFAAMTTMSCSSDETGLETPPAGSDLIMIDVASTRLQTRASVSDNAIEEAVSHLDIVIFEETGAYKYSERINVNTPAGTVRLKAKRSSDFAEGDKYYVYVIANSNLPESKFKSLATRDELIALPQSDERLHITGTSISGAPSHFLMDGAAFLNGGAEPGTPAPIVLNNGNVGENTQLKVFLRRAAAKVVMHLAKGDKVTFVSNGHEGYYVRNLPYVTNVITPTVPYTELRTPDKINGDYFEWSSSMVTITAYVYAHSWLGASFYEEGTSMIINVPVVYEGVSYENSYYQIAMSKDSRFDRNHIYTVTGTINAPGAEEVSEPVTIDDLKYSVRNWDMVPVDVNGENAPQYLTVNLDTMRMHNVATDAEALQFSSSSPITITAIEPYYIDKFGIRQNYTGGMIAGTTEGGISGNITVSSPIPTNNTIRYFKLAIVNEEGLKDTVVVEQYPLIYITNQQGWFSYRDDFKGNSGGVTTYLNRGNSRYVSVGLNDNNWNNKYNYSTTSTSRGSVNTNSFWHSKVVSSTNPSTGKSTTSFYEWPQDQTEVSISGTCETNTNARMYHVRVTATSNKYKVGRPRMDANGYTDSGTDNAELVSPSFMIASRLGAIYSSYGKLSSVTDSINSMGGKTMRDNNNNGISDRLEIFRDHCAQYVEVYKDENGNTVVLDDWRVPTRAEIGIIIDLQGDEDTNADAIDYLLNGYYYMSANGPVYNHQGNNNNTNTSAIRCVRDAYK